MADDRDVFLKQQREDFCLILQEAAAARSALCEHELVIRLDNIIALARKAVERDENRTRIAPDVLE